MATRFSSLFFDPPPAPASVLRIGEPRTFAPGEMLVESNVPVGGCYYIVKGLVFAVDFTENGEKVFGLIVDRDTLLAETAMLVGSPLSIGFQAQIQTRALFIPERAFVGLFEKDIEVAHYAARLCAAKMLAVKEIYLNRKRESVMWRTCNVFLGFAYRYGEDFERGKLIAFPLSHQLVADFVNANRITVTKCMQDLKKAGLVRRINDVYHIPDIKRLEQFARTQANSCEHRTEAC